MKRKFDVIKTLQGFDELVSEILAIVVTWIAPAPSSYIVGMGAYEKLGWHWSVCIMLAVAVEGLGIVSVSSALKAWEWNTSKTKTDPAAPFALTVGLVIVYVASAIMLSVVIDVYEPLLPIAPALMPLLTVVAAVNIGVRAGHNRRVKQKADAKLERQLKRRPSGEKPNGETAKPSGEMAKSREKARRWGQLQHGDIKKLAAMSAPEIATEYGLRPRTARDWAARARLEFSKNGTH